MAKTLIDVDEEQRKARFGAAATRSLGLPDLLIAAVAEVTTQEMQWVVRRGSVP